MRELIDRLLDSIINGSMSAMPNKNASRWFRLIMIITLIVIMLGIIVGGIVALKETVLGGIIIIVIGIILFVKVISRIQKFLKNNKR